MFDFILIVPGRACTAPIRIFSSLSFLRISIKQESPVRSSLHTIWSIFYFSPAYATASRTALNEEPSAEASRGSSLTTTLLASPRYASSSSPLQDLFCYSTYGLIWFHLCLFIFRKIYKPLDLLVFQLLVKVGSFVAWPVLYVREDCDSGWIFEIVGLEEVEAVLLLARLPISEYMDIGTWQKTSNN